jgi:hypothetical protein
LAALVAAIFLLPLTFRSPADTTRKPLPCKCAAPRVPMRGANSILNHLGAPFGPAGAPFFCQRGAFLFLLRPSLLQPTGHDPETFTLQSSALPRVTLARVPGSPNSTRCLPRRRVFCATSARGLRHARNNRRSIISDCCFPALAFHQRQGIMRQLTRLSPGHIVVVVDSGSLVNSTSISGGCYPATGSTGLMSAAVPRHRPPPHCRDEPSHSRALLRRCHS